MALLQPPSSLLGLPPATANPHRLDLRRRAASASPSASRIRPASCVRAIPHRLHLLLPHVVTRLSSSSARAFSCVASQPAPATSLPPCVAARSRAEGRLPIISSPSHISLSMPSLHAALPHLYGVSGSTLLRCTSTTFSGLSPPPCSWVSGSLPPSNQESTALCQWPFVNMLPFCRRLLNQGDRGSIVAALLLEVQEPFLPDSIW